MKRVPNQDVDMQIVPGPSAGESDVVISVKRTKPWSLSVSADDSGLRLTGQLQGNVSLTIDNPLGLSDLLNVSYNHDLNGHASQYGAHGSSAYYSIPWGNWTFTNSGTIKAANSFAISAQSVDSSFGTLQSGGQMSLVTAKDVNLTSATLNAGSLALQAGGNLVLNTAVNTLDQVSATGATRVRAIEIQEKIREKLNNQYERDSRHVV